MTIFDEVREDIENGCAIDDYNISSYGNERLHTLKKLKAIALAGDIHNHSAYEFGDPDSGLVFQSDLYELAMELGAY